jgi:DNA repair exonuclease SbcCD ATPase subunit
MTNEHSESSTSENLFPDKPHEVIGRLGMGFSKINNKLTNLLEENQGLKQRCKNFQQQHRDLKGKLREKDENIENLQQRFQNLEKQRNEETEKFENLQQRFRNLEKQRNEEIKQLKQQCNNLQQQHQEILQVNSDLKEKLQEKNRNFEELQRCFQNLEKRKNEEIQQLEIISQNLAKNLEILELEDIDENDINALKESNKCLIDKIGEQNYNFHDIENHSFNEGMYSSCKLKNK